MIISRQALHLFSTDFVCHVGKLSSIVTIFNPSGLCLLKGNKVPSPCVSPQGGNVPRTYLLHEESVTWKIMTSSVKAKIWKWSTAVAVAKKKINSGFQFQFQFQGFQFQFHFQFHQFQFQFQFQFWNWNWNWPAIPIPELNWPQPCAR